MALNSSQKRKAREKLAKKRGVSASSITDLDIQGALDGGLLTSYELGGSSSYDSGSSSSSSSDSGCY